MLFWKIYASASLLLLTGLAGRPADPTGSAAAEDVTAGLAKSIQGYKVGDPARYRDLVTPLRTDKAALAPDGKHIAYAVRLGDEVYIYIVAVDQPSVIKSKTLIHKIEYNSSDPKLSQFGLVNWIGWVTTTRLIVASSAISLKGRNRHVGTIAALDADGPNLRILAVPGDLTEIGSGVTNDAALLWIAGHDPDRVNAIIFVANTSVRFGRRGPHKRLLVPWRLDGLTGEMTRLGEVFVDSADHALHDRTGRARITAARTWHTPDLDAQILHQRGIHPESAVPLDQATGWSGFRFSTAAALDESSVPLGFAGTNDTLYYASNVGRNTFGIYAVDLITKQRLPGSLESPSVDLLNPHLGTFTGTEYFGFTGPESDDDILMRWHPSSQLVIDRFTHKLAGVRYETTARTAAWLRPELRAVQARLAAERPGRNAEILEWDQSLNRFLVREQSPADAGSFFIFDLKKNIYIDLVRRGAEPEDGSIAQLTSFDFKLPDGSRIDGVLALPKDSKVKKIPLVLLCPDYPWQRRGASYQREFEALTRMGFAVALYNGRGAWGTGRKERQKLQGDYVAMQAADVVAVADHLASNFNNVSAKAVALFGQGHGGHVALRALQLHQQRFRCAVTVDAWLHGNALLDAVVQSKPLRGSYEKVTRPTPTPLTKRPELIKAPVFTIVEFSQSPRFHANTALHRAVKRNAADSELLVHTDRLAPKPELLARQWARTESFLNYVLYNFSVSLGELEVLPDEAKARQP